MGCSRLSCPIEAVSTVLGASGREPVCFRHEREAVDRYGYADALPQGLGQFQGTAREAVLALRGEDSVDQPQEPSDD